MFGGRAMELIITVYSRVHGFQLFLFKDNGIAVDYCGMNRAEIVTKRCDQG